MQNIITNYAQDCVIFFYQKVNVTVGRAPIRVKIEILHTLKWHLFWATVISDMWHM